MPVVPYKPLDIQDPQELVSSIRARRGGTLLNLDRILLHSPAFAAGWNSFLGAVRNSLIIPAKLRELAICTVAIINDAEYEFIQHAPELIKAGGSEAQLAALKRLDDLSPESSEFDHQEFAVIKLSQEMTRSVKVNDKTMQAVKSTLDNDQQLMELIGVIATYNMVSRYLVALGIEPE
ncbi:MAG: carboxymuconolactone decarboxylase family protein [Deltaproteobacteria bacterium]|nr:carboxymuconolactone decarboxylase family protein [Deltaproteobacteria bacterium]MCW9050023.1 carboxymuconolactone decarboxylase family protein [Deltaproteobacteria bacterium]